MATWITVGALAEAAVKQNKMDIQNDTLIPSLETELREINKGINNLVKLAEKGIISDTVTDRLQQLEREKRVVERRLVEASDDIIILEKEHIVWWLTRFLDGDINDEEYRRSLIDLFVNSVTVWDEPDGEFRITTMYNLTDRPSKTAKISPDGSVLGLSGAPMNAYPNHFLVNIWIGRTTIHRQD